MNIDDIVLKVIDYLNNWPYVESWCDRHGTRELLDRLRQECQELS